jgi:DnaJ-domain-containing protein 1
LKRRYRELCLGYHPDRFGAHDTRTQRLWNAIQKAYQAGNLEQLRLIQTDIALEAGQKELSCSDLDDLNASLNRAILDTRREVRTHKRTFFWGFSTWSTERRQDAHDIIQDEYELNLQAINWRISQIEQELQRVRTAYSARRPAGQRGRPRGRPRGRRNGPAAND